MVYNSVLEIMVKTPSRQNWQTTTSERFNKLLDCIAGTPGSYGVYWEQKLGSEGMLQILLIIGEKFG